MTTALVAVVCLVVGFIVGRQTAKSSSGGGGTGGAAGGGGSSHPTQQV